MAGTPVPAIFFMVHACSFLFRPLSEWAKKCDHWFFRRSRLEVRPQREKRAIMRLKTLLLATTVCTVAGLVGAQAQTLSGTVSSTEEGQMEGVLVSAKKEGSTVTTTVVTNDKGEFSFPVGRLEPGKYTITTRAVGFTLAGPKSVDVTAAGATAELKLGKARNLAPQLSNGEWLLSAPGADQFK